MTELLSLCRLFAGEGSGHPLLAEVRRLASRFHRLPPGDLALFESDPERFIAFLFGAWHAGRTVWLAADQQPANVSALREFGVVPLSEALAASEAPSEGECLPLGALDECAKNLVLFTSGSSGAPKPVRKCLRQFEAEIAALELAFGAHLQGLPVLGTVSLQHVYGLLFRVLWPLASRRENLFPQIAFPEQWSEWATRPHVLVSSPSLLSRWPIGRTGVRPSVVFSSGGPLASEAARHAIDALSAPIIEVLGSTETGGIAYREAASAGAWQALPGVEMRIDGERLLLRSPHLEDSTEWRATDDRASLSDDGKLQLLGRADRIVKIGEKRVSLDAVENALLGSGLIADSRALVLPDAARGFALVAVVSSHGRQALNEQGKSDVIRCLKKLLLEHVELSCLPRRWRFVDALPVNAQGKVTHASLVELFRPRNPQVTWLERGAVTARLQLVVPPDLLFFDGHFEQSPVVPGVVLIDWAVHYIETAFGLSAPLAGIDVLKFQKLVLPDSRMALTLTRIEGKPAVSVAFTSEEGSHASARFRYPEQERLA